MVGHAPRAEDFVTRSGACPGDALVVTGELGGAAAGLLLLEDPALAAGSHGRRRPPPPPARSHPRLAAGRALAEAGATAMIDVSDGLVGDAHHVALASGVLLVIDSEALPIAPGVAEVAAAADRDPLELGRRGRRGLRVAGGATAGPVEAARSALARSGTPLTQIGRVEAAGEAGPRAEVRRRGGEAVPSRGFDQLRPRRPR